MSQKKYVPPASEARPDLFPVVLRCERQLKRFTCDGSAFAVTLDKNDALVLRCLKCGGSRSARAGVLAKYAESLRELRRAIFEDIGGAP